MILPPWIERTQEEAYHFNPAFVGALSFEFIKAYENAKRAPAPFPLVFCALPLSLYPDSRMRLPNTTRTRLLSWIEKTPEALVGFSGRAHNLVPFVKEGIRYAALREAIVFDDSGRVSTGAQKAAFTNSFMESVESEVRDIVKSVRMVGKWFAGGGETQTILVSLGVRI